MLGGDSSNGSHLPVVCLCTTVPGRQEVLNYWSSLHLPLFLSSSSLFCCSVAPTLWIHRFPLFLQPDSKPCTSRCFPLLCPLLMLSPKSSILPSPDTKPSMSLYQFADISYSTGSIPPFSQKNVFQCSSLAFHLEIKQFVQFILKPCSFQNMISLLRGDQEG